MNSPAVIVIGAVVEKYWMLIKQQVNYLRKENENQV